MAEPVVRFETLGQSGRIALDVTVHGQGLLLTMRGAWHDAVPQAVADQVQAAMSRHKPRVLAVDLTNCPHLVSVTLGFLVVTWQSAQAVGARSAVIAAPPKVMALLRILGLTQFFTSVHSTAELIAALDA